MIRQYLEDRAGTWDKFLLELYFAYNPSLHDATNFTPAFLNFGWEIHAKYIPTSDSEINIQNLVTKMNNLHKVHDLAIHNQENNAKRTDQGRFQCPLKVGDRVWNQDFFARPLDPKFEGPYKIAGISAQNSFQLVTKEDIPIGVFHLKDLKLDTGYDSDSSEASSSSVLLLYD